MHLDVKPITLQVLNNCRISDSRHAGLYSVCGLALRLRDLYKWEHGLDPWEEKDPAEVLDWIGHREQAWEEMGDVNYSDILISGIPYDPFDVEGINDTLAGSGFFYGAGYMHSMKPSFFLAELEARKQMDGYTVYILGRELARDLATVPALSQNGSILIRKTSALYFLWDKIFFINISGKSALRFALKTYGLKDHSPETMKKNLSKIVSAEMETYIYHELGELKDTNFDRTQWQEMVSAFPHTPVELLLRSVKDILADTNPWGRLQYIVRERKAASLAFYVAFYDGLPKILFPELKGAFEEFMESCNWAVMEKAISIGYETARRYANSLRDIYAAGKKKGNMDWAAAEIENRLLAPLGVGA
jgi:hypothetical protein